MHREKEQHEISKDSGDFGLNLNYQEEKIEKFIEAGKTLRQEAMSYLGKYCIVLMKSISSLRYLIG